MKNIIFLITLLISLTLCLGGDCEFKGKSLKTGEKYQPPGECALYTCNGRGSVTGKTCPVVQSLKPCKFSPSDLSKPYPQCCPHHNC